MKKISVKKFGIIVSILMMLISIIPFYLVEIYEEQLPSRVENFFITTFLLAFILFSLALIMRDHRENSDRYKRD